MISRVTWEKFKESGLLWWINRMLHLFGYVICFDYNDKGELENVYPARCKFRGFTEKIEDKGFKDLTNHLKENIDFIKEDLED